MFCAGSIFESSNEMVLWRTAGKQTKVCSLDDIHGDQRYRMLGGSDCQNRPIIGGAFGTVNQQVVVDGCRVNLERRAPSEPISVAYMITPGSGP